VFNKATATEIAKTIGTTVLTTSTLDVTGVTSF